MSEEEKDIRWKQRFENFESSLRHLEDALQLTFPSDISDILKVGVIKMYEITLELAWKTMKDYLESQEVPVKFPREVIKEAFKYELIDDGDVWLAMLEDRNTLVHVYNEENANKIYQVIVDLYFKMLLELYSKLKSYV